MTDAQLWDRLKVKGLEGQFLWEMQHGYELSPRLSEGILEAVKLIFSQEVDFKAGRVQVWVIAQGEAAGKSVKDLKKVSVWVTLDAGPEDLEIYRKYGAIYLRRMRILRVTEQIVDSGGVATQEDLARLFQVDTRTIRRDISYLRVEGYEVITRGVWCDIGRTTSHRVIIVEKYLKNYSYTEICRQTRHSAKAVKRYVTTFARVATLMARGITNPKSICFYVGISERLAEEYIKLYNEFIDHEVYGSRLKDLIKQTLARPEYVTPQKMVRA